MTEFDCPEVTQCGWQDIKIQLLTIFQWKKNTVAHCPIAKQTDD